MASPFPGIDPYLESQGYWPDFHASLILYCRDALNDVLPDSYEARLGEQRRLVELNEPPVRTVLPDVAILERPTIGKVTSEPQAAVLTIEPVTMGLPVAEVEEVRDLWIEVRHRPDRQLITAIELLSPWNKNGEGYWEYRAKRRRLIRQNVNLVELDLLVQGQRLPMDQELPARRLLRIHLSSRSPSQLRRIRLVGASAFAEDSDTTASSGCRCDSRSYIAFCRRLRAGTLCACARLFHAAGPSVGVGRSCVG